MEPGKLLECEKEDVNIEFFKDNLVVSGESRAGDNLSEGEPIPAKLSVSSDNQIVENSILTCIIG